MNTHGETWDMAHGRHLEDGSHYSRRRAVKHSGSIVSGVRQSGFNLLSLLHLPLRCPESKLLNSPGPLYKIYMEPKL